MPTPRRVRRRFRFLGSLTHLCEKDIWQHERAVVQKGYRFEAVLFGAVVGGFSVEHLVPVEF